MNKWEFYVRRKIKADLYQGDPGKLTEQVREGAMIVEAIVSAVSSAVMKHIIKEKVRKETMRYLDHLIRIKRFKKTRRWPAV